MDKEQAVIYLIDDIITQLAVLSRCEHLPTESMLKRWRKTLEECRDALESLVEKEADRG